MNPNRFDQISRTFADRRLSRRSTIVAGSVGLAAGLFAAGGPRAFAQEASPAAKTDSPATTRRTDPEFLFAQAFEAGTMAPKSGDDTSFVLTLTGAAAETWYFSDRPDRIFGMAPTQQFLDGLGFTPTNPPNAAVVAKTKDGKDDTVVIVELRNPTYDPDANILTYDIRMLADYDEPELSHAAVQQADHMLPPTFGTGGLFIDDCANGTTTCTVVSTGVEVGTIVIGQCWSWKHMTCDPCDSNYDMACAYAYPDQCYTTTIINGDPIPTSLCVG